MAASGTIQQAIRTGYRLQIAWTVDSQSVANNTSTVTAKVQLVSTGSSYTINSSASKSGSLTINGTKYSFTFTAALSGSQTKEIFKKTVTISHAADGTKTCAFSATAGINVTLSGTYYGNVTASGNGVFNTIARASTISSVTSSVAVNGTNTVTVNIARASSNFTHTVEFAFGSYSHTITGVATSTSFAIPTAWLNAIPNATSGTAAVAVTTYSGSTKIGFSATGTFTLTVPATVVPTISAVSLSEAVSGLAAQFGSYVQNKSKIAVSITSAGALSSTIKSYKTTIQGTTYTASSFTSGLLTQSGTSNVSITVTDSRGRTATTTRSITVAAYSSPTIATFTAVRANGLGSADDNGTMALARLVFSVSAVNNKNTKSYVVESKPKTSDVWTTISSGSTYTYDNNMIVNGNFSPDASYDLRISLTDYFGTVTAQTDIATAFTLMDFNTSGKGIAFGKVSESDAFECAMPAVFSNTFRINGGVSPAHVAGVTAITSSDGAGQYVKLLSFPIDIYTGWNYSSLILSFEECVFGIFSGILDLHIRNSVSSGTIAQQVFACHDCRGNPYHYSFYLTVEDNIASVYWLCRSNYYGISVRLINGYMSHAGFNGITWDGVTKTTTSPGGVLCEYQHGTSGLITAHRNNVNQNLVAANTYETVKFTTATTSGYGLTLNSNGGVVIGDGVKMVRISGQITAGAQSNGMKVAAIWGNEVTSHLSRTQAYITTANPQTIVFAPKLVSVAKGDVLTMRFYGAQGDVAYGGTMQTYFTVESVG